MVPGGNPSASLSLGTSLYTREALKGKIPEAVCKNRFRDYFIIIRRPKPTHQHAKAYFTLRGNISLRKEFHIIFQKPLKDNISLHIKAPP